MENPRSRGYKSLVETPRLIRSRSGAPAISLEQLNSTHCSKSPASQNRSKSRSRSRSTKVEQENFTSPSIVITTTTSSTSKNDKKKNPQLDGAFTKFLQRSKEGSNNGGEVVVSKRTRPPLSVGPTSPSAWALSPGRILPSSTVAKSSGNYIGADVAASNHGMSGVFKYFRQKKAEKVQQTEFHRFCAVHNRLLQWRFANAKAQAAMTARKRFAERKIFNVWLEMIAIRKSSMEMRIQIQRLKQEMRLHHIMSSQLFLLKEWARLEPKNSEAVGRVARKLSAVSLKLPLLQDAKGDVFLVKDAMIAAIGVVECIEKLIMKFQSQAEKACYLLTELTIMANDQKYYLGELEKWISFVASLKEEERSLRAHLFQIAMEPKHGKSTEIAD